MCGFDEWRLNNFGLEHDKTTDFVEPAIGGTSLLYVVYRLAIATFFCVAIIYSIANFSVPTMWPNYMSHWTFTLITLNTILQAICVTRHYIERGELRQTESQKMPLIYKVIWMLQNITYVTAPVVSYLYWTFNNNGRCLSRGRDCLSMANVPYTANSLYAMVDFFVTAIPVRILHFIHAILFITVYLSFTLVIYWLDIGFTHYEKPKIFIVLEHAFSNERWIGIGWFFIVATTGVLIHCFVFALHQLREVMYRSCRIWVGSYNWGNAEMMSSEHRD